MDATPSEPNPYAPPRSAVSRRGPAGSASGPLLRRVLVALAVVVSSLVAFVATCLPAGLAILATGRPAPPPPATVLGLACLVGLGGATLTGWAVSRWLGRRRRPRGGDWAAPDDWHPRPGSPRILI